MHFLPLYSFSSEPSSASLLNCTHLQATSSVTLWPCAYTWSFWERIGITLSPIPLTSSIKPWLRQTLITDYEANDRCEAVTRKAQSCNRLEAISISKTRSTHVAHADLKLALVAEDDLNLWLSCLSFPSVEAVHYHSVFMCCQGLNPILCYTKQAHYTSQLLSWGFSDY